MSDTNSIKFLQKTVIEHCAARGWEIDPRSLAASITIEAAELLEHYQFNDYHLRPDDHEIPEEAADVMIYLLQFCHAKNINLGEEVIKKLEKASKKYPIGQSAEQHYKNKLRNRGKDY